MIKNADSKALAFFVIEESVAVNPYFESEALYINV
jgi:hypothetical protein